MHQGHRARPEAFRRGDANVRPAAVRARMSARAAALPGLRLRALNETLCLPHSGDLMARGTYSNGKRLATLLLLGCPGALSAQIDRKLAALMPSSCIEHLPSSAFKRVAVYAYVDLPDSVSASFGQSADDFLQEVVDGTQHRLGASGNRLPVGEPAVSWRGLDVSLHLVAYRNGGIVVVHRDSTSGVASAAALLARTVDSMSTRGQLDWSADTARDSVSFDIAFVRPVFDSTGRVEMPTHKRYAVPVFSVLAPWEQKVELKPGQKKPRYPFGA